MTPLIYGMPGDETIAAGLIAELDAEMGAIEVRHFPDGETYVRLLTSPRGREVAIVCSLDRPDAKSMALYFAACTARELGAAKVGLISPYLGYMRQDTQFHSGEAVTSVYYGRWLSQFLDWLVTVDPHLHRHASLQCVYSIDTAAAPAAPAIARWIKSRVAAPVVIGPDAESAQWAERIAADAGCPFVVAEKRRRGDFDVEVALPDMTPWQEHTPVLIDDIVSTARTMIAAIKQLRAARITEPPVCIGVHALFAADAYDALVAAGAGAIATCNTVAHASNIINVVPEIANAARRFIGAAVGAGRLQSMASPAANPGSSR